MPSSGRTFRLWIASDEEKTIVALRRLKVIRKPLVYERGSVTDLRAVSPEAASRINPVIAVGAAVLLAGLWLFALRIPMLAVAAIVMIIVGFVIKSGRLWRGRCATRRSCWIKKGKSDRSLWTFLGTRLARRR